MQWAGSPEARTTITQLAGSAPYGCNAHITNHRLHLCFFFVWDTHRWGASHLELLCDQQPSEYQSLLS